MKIRTGFVSNSSSSSYVINAKISGLTYERKNKLSHLIQAFLESGEDYEEVENEN